MIQEENIFDLNEKVLITFKNEEYVLNAYALLSRDRGISTKESLIISIKKESTNELWKGKYTNNYVEEITKKTGNFKKFSVFIEMLFSAIKMSSKTVTLDLLTLEDVKKLRENKSDNERIDTAESNKPSKNKLFLILTYSAAFDRVHYPLPLTFQGFGDELNTITLVEKLKKEVEILKSEKESNINEISRLLRENDKLKYEMKQLQDVNHDNSTVFNAFEEKTDFKHTRITQFVKKEFDVIIKLYRQKKMHSLIHDKLMTLQKYILQAFSKYENDKKKLEDELVEKKGEIETLKNKIKILQSRQNSVTKKKSVSSISKQRSSSISSIKKEVKSSGYNVIKSRPLKPPFLTKDKSKSSKRNTSRNSSVSSFKRFDPTAYIREREQKLEERRARSRELSLKSRYSRNNSNVSSTRNLSKTNIKSNYSSNSLYSSRSKSIDRGSLTKKKIYSDKSIYHSKYDRSSSTVRASGVKNSRNNSLSKISNTSSHQPIKKSSSKKVVSKVSVSKSRNSSLSNIKSNRDHSLSRKTNKTYSSYISSPKKVSNNKSSHLKGKGSKRSSSITSSVNHIPIKNSFKSKAKSKERVLIQKLHNDDSNVGNDTIDYESQYMHDNDFEELKSEDKYNENTETITEKDNFNYNNTNTEIITEKGDHWNSYDMTESQDIDARLEAIQKYLKDTQEEL
ncbi:hypothetical protein BCR32DRAFT_288879 [Anaeromyces robustus]|uniref:Uncharacterized protein n=1 Tax=Anaeromyces robustus TaxID=1754192 RepID=A0A1Y1XQU1_9FUNG|nr:hypothetical protein BCR32DRAFT_288879 [Anaeromyces robustus]|eukprot:ORX88131.1 hypothetical protein BCR32DRAFT_288879 [Anaeromyces robustus]